MTSRRQFVLAGALCALSPNVFGQKRPVRVGMLSGRPLKVSLYAAPVVRRLAELGYRDGAGMVLEYRSSDGAAERQAKQARELVDAKCDLIFALGDHLAARALIDLRSGVPGVFFAGDYDPIEKGIVKSLSRPDGNMTGVYVPQGIMVAKRVELLRELLPHASRFLVLADVWSSEYVPAAQKAADTLRMKLSVAEFSKKPYDFATALEVGRREGAEGVVLMNSPVFAERGAEMVALLAKHRLPSIGGAGYTGSVLRYYGNIDKAGARVAEIGVRVLKGETPANIPVEQGDEYVLLVDAKAAHTMGLKIPTALRMRATRVIE